MKKSIQFIAFLIFSNYVFCQRVPAFDILFKDKVASVSEQNIDEVYDLILTLNDELKRPKDGILIYDKQFIPNQNSRLDEIDNILNQIKKNLGFNIINNEDEYYLEINSQFEYSNTGPLDLENYRIEILNSNVELLSEFSAVPIDPLDYSENKEMDLATADLNLVYLIASKPSKLDLTFKISAFTDSQPVIISKNDKHKMVQLKDSNFEIINLTNNDLALKIDDLEDVEIYAYKDNKISKIRGLSKLPIYKEIYDYIINTEFFTKEDLFKRFPIDAIMAINTDDKYTVLISSEYNIDSEMLMEFKNYKSIQTQFIKDAL